MRAVRLVSALLLVLGACAPSVPAPAPAPAIAPLPGPKRLAPADVGMLQAELAGDRARLAAYRALPACAPSGPVECRDERTDGAIAAAEQSASNALRSRLPTARERLRALRAAIKQLPQGSSDHD